MLWTFSTQPCFLSLGQQWTRLFQSVWYVTSGMHSWGWLEYSEVFDRVFCFPCWLFGQDVPARNTWVLSVSSTTSSAKRYAVFEAVQESVGVQELTRKSLSGTCWSCRAEALRGVRKRLRRDSEDTRNISDHDPSSGAEATSLLGVICRFDFVFNLLNLDESLQSLTYCQSICN